MTTFLRARFLRLLALVLVTAVAASACGKYSISNIRSLKAFSDANNLYKKGEYKGAIARYEDSVRHNPEQELVYFFLGHANEMLYKPARKGEPDNDAFLLKAVENYRLAIDKLADSKEEKAGDVRQLAYEYLISAYGPGKLDDFSKAEPIAQQLIAMNPNDPQRYQMLATLYQDQGRFEEAEKYFLKAVEVRPNDPLTYARVATFYNSQGDFEKTMEMWNKRANAEPNNPEAWQTIAQYYWEKAEKDKTLPAPKAREYILKGLEATNRALQLNPEYFQALAFKGILLQLQARYEKDPAVQKKLIAEGEALNKQAIEVQKKQSGATPATPPKGK